MIDPFSQESVAEMRRLMSTAPEVGPETPRKYSNLASVLELAGMFKPVEIVPLKEFNNRYRVDNPGPGYCN